MAYHKQPLPSPHPHSAILSIASIASIATVFFGEADFLFSSIALNRIPPNLTKSSSAIKNSRKGKSRDSWQHFL